MDFPIYSLVLSTERSGVADSQFFGSYLYFDGEKDLSTFCHENSIKYFLRSMLKPIQASILADEEIYDYFNLTNEELAVIQGSHTGEPVHIELVNSILKKIGLNENALLCPVIEPLNTNCYPKNTVYSKLHNNCSGKHSMMLAYCVYHNLDYSNYTSPNHPVQIKIKEKLLNYAKTDSLAETKDGCTVPVWGLNIENIKNAVLNYYIDKKNEKLIKAYKSNPYIIGGKDNFGIRTDTKISNLSSDLVSKVGAGGFIYVYNLKTKTLLIVKMAQDNNKAREILTLELLYRTGNLKERFYDINIYTEDNNPIGKYIFNL